MTTLASFPGTGWALAFHGSAQTFTEFTETASIGRGFETNSHLGVHLAYAAETAVSYAEMAVAERCMAETFPVEPSIYLVAYRVGKRLDASHEEFFCVPLTKPEDDSDHPLWVADPKYDSPEKLAIGYRKHLQAEGYITLERDEVEDMGAHIIVLHPKDTVILDLFTGADTLARIAKLDERLRQGPRLSDEARLQRIREGLTNTS